MTGSAKLFLVLGTLFAAAAVTLGAFGAHGLRARLSADALEIYQTGVQYHFWHALGLLAVGVVSLHLPESGWLRAAGVLLALGIVLFSGSLYVLALGGAKSFGAVAPIGGSALILGWIAFAIAVLRA
jgi:uncharacterized membrane protein YgdD (TMEM256/DUF423 family)